jgi:hypothetical protein
MLNVCEVYASGTRVAIQKEPGFSTAGRFYAGANIVEVGEWS